MEQINLINDTLYIVIPAYNEEENIFRCVNDWYPIIEEHNGSGNSRLIIVNDGSKDRTLELLNQLVQSRPLLTCLTKSNGGHGSAVLFGYQYALENGAKWIFQTDSDGQTDPAEFAQFWENRNDYDAVIGERIVRGDGIARKVVENVVCLLLWIIFGIRIKDANAPFRLMKAKLVEKYINRIPPNYNLPNIMLTTFFVYFEEKALFLPISFRSRHRGSTSIKPGKIIQIGWKAIGDFWEFHKSM